MNYYIFRHGVTYYSKNDLPYGEHVEDAEILPESIPAIEKIGNYLKGVVTDLNVCSNYKRCRQTAEIVSEISGKEFVIDPLLHDYDPRKETVEDTVKRIESFYSQLTTHNLQYTSVCICTHGYPITMLKDLITTGKVDLSHIDIYPNPGVLTIIKEGAVEEIDFNHKD